MSFVFCFFWAGVDTAFALEKLIKKSHRSYRLDLKFPIIFGVAEILRGDRERPRSSPNKSLISLSLSLSREGLGRRRRRERAARRRREAAIKARERREEETTPPILEKWAKMTILLPRSGRTNARRFLWGKVESAESPLEPLCTAAFAGTPREGLESLMLMPLRPEFMGVSESRSRAENVPRMLILGYVSLWTRARTTLEFPHFFTHRCRPRFLRPSSLRESSAVEWTSEEQDSAESLSESA